MNQQKDMTYFHKLTQKAFTIKNTFIDAECVAECTPPRRSSVPASSRLCCERLSSIFHEKTLETHLDSDDSTVAHLDSDDSTVDSDSGVETPMSLDDAYLAEESPPGFFMYPQVSCPPPPAPLTQNVMAANQCQRLNSNACAFTPQSAIEEPAGEGYKHHFANIVLWAKKTMEACEHVAFVELSTTESGWNIVVRPRGETGDQTPCLQSMAKQAILDAASHSRCVYLMGYRSPMPFTMRPQGFEATLGVMESPAAACWHVFKKGFCRHGADCCKEHPVCQIPVHVVVEGVQCNPCSYVESEFKQQVASMTMAMTSTMGESPYVERVEAFKDTNCQSWIVEVTAKQHPTSHKDYLLSLAKSALFSASCTSTIVYIMGYAEKPFVNTSEGFISILGDLQDDTKACWDLYSKGICSRDCDCRWQHPESLMPIRIVVKENSASASVA